MMDSESKALNKLNIQAAEHGHRLETMGFVKTKRSTRCDDDYDNQYHHAPNSGKNFHHYDDEPELND